MIHTLAPGEPSFDLALIAEASTISCSVISSAESACVPYFANRDDAETMWTASQPNLSSAIDSTNFVLPEFGVELLTSIAPSLSSKGSASLSFLTSSIALVMALQYESSSAIVVSNSFSRFSRLRMESFLVPTLETFDNIADILIDKESTISSS